MKWSSIIIIINFLWNFLTKKWKKQNFMEPTPWLLPPGTKSQNLTWIWMSYDAKQFIVECQGRGLLELKSWQLLTCHVMEIAKDLRENSPFCMAKLLKLEMFSWELLITTNIWWHKWRFILQDEFILSRGYPEYSLRDSRLHLITKKLRQKIN